MMRRFAILAICLLATATAKTKRTCETCPVRSVDPVATVPFAHADNSHGCTTRVRRGFLLPDPKCTPGAVNPTLTLAVLKNKTFGTGCVRDCVTHETAKNATYGFYNIAHPAGNRGRAQTCELDHLVSLELGGADSLDNMWPQCGPTRVKLANRFFKIKDAVENYLAAQVRAGAMDLGEAQAGIANDWTQYVEVATGFCSQNPKKCKPIK